MPKTDAERSREYRRRKRETKQKGEKKIKKPAKSSADRVREFRARRKELMQQTNKQNENDSSKVNDNVPGLTDSNIKMKNEIEDVKVQTDTNEKIYKINTMEISNENVKKSNVSELDKFKRRLIRAIARLLYKENKPEEDIWNELKTETGCDCELLWSRMRALTIKKLVRLFTAEDKIENITKIAQLSVTDWLLYDLVLVHEKVDVIGQELGHKEEPAFLRDLFDLVEEFNIEQAVGEELSKMWFDATAKYNNTGKRQCSPMLLQKRWYQLKESSRNNFYNFWFQYRGDSRKLEKANEFKPSDLQLDIVKRYKEIVTKPFVNWEELIKERRVALPEDFERLRLAQIKITISENEPDLQVIETEVETIDLEEINDSDDDNREGNDFNIDIVKIESLAEHDDEVSVLESVHIPLKESGSSDINGDTRVKTTRSMNNRDYNESEIIESDSEQIMPRICSVTSTACLESVEDKDASEDLPSNEIDIDSETRAKSVESVNNTLKEIVKNVVENQINTNFDENSDTSKKEVLKFETAIEELRSNSIIDLDKAASINTGDTYLSNDMRFDDFSKNINFIDDGIKFVDDGIEYTDDDCIEEYNLKSAKKSETVEEANEEEPTIDLKLLLTSVVYTKKLDDMDVFRFIDYNSVKDNRVLQNAERESKPEDSKSINMKRMLQECNDDDSGQVGSGSGVVSPDGDVPTSSWLFRKPKVNSYNSIQLCKNPDFNTRLKRLSAAFYTSERNRLQLKRCKPLTVDLHKTFEAKLINNTLYLKKNINSNIRITLNETISTSYKTEPPEILAPSVDNENAGDQKNFIEQTSEIRRERNRVINLPDIVQIRRVNQGLLVAEVSPIQVSNPVHEVNTKAMNDLNTEIKPLFSNMSPMAIDKEVFEPRANVSQFSFETDKVHSDNDSSQLAQTVNIDIEQSETLSSKCNVIDSAKNSKEQYNKCSQPLPKNKIKTYRKPSYMQLSWQPKPQSTKTDAIDCLLAADTVERILILCKNDYVPPDPKVLKPKRKKKTVIADINLTENQVAVSKKTAIKEKKNATQTRKPRKSKCRINITSQTTNIKNVCCWSRQKIENYYKVKTGRHYCPENQCVCCCKADLAVQTLALEEQRKRCELIILSEEESVTITVAKKHHPVSKVTVGTNTDYDKDFEDQFANSFNLLKDNANQVTPIISLPLGNLPQTFSNESGCQTLTPNRIEKPPSSAALGNKITEVAGTPKNKPKIPICLGKNKILLCSFKPTGGTVSVQNLKKYNQNCQSEQMFVPDGCHLVLLPNRELALSIDPGVELDANQLSHLPSLIATVQKQINVMATSESNLEPNKITMNEEIVHLSDNENSSIKENANNNLNINDSNTSKSSSIQMNIDSSDANIVTIAGAGAGITNEEKQIPNRDSNNLPSPKQSCNTPEPATAKNTTTTDIRDVIETSTNVITSKDNINGEAIDNSTNNTEDASGVNKKTILSDLMEMSGISADDINISNNDVDLASSEENGSNIVSGAANNECVPIIQQVLSQTDSSTDLQREYANITKRIGIHPITNNIVVRAALLRCPELNIVSSYPELKFAYENAAQFFKMNVVSGIIVPINVCFKKDMEKVRMQGRKRVSEVSTSVIDLTNDNDVATHSSTIRSTEPKIPTRITNESGVETSEIIQPDKTKDPIKPIKLFKAIHPSILRYSGRSLLVRPLKKSTVIEKKYIGITENKRKEGLHVKKFDADNKPTNEIVSDAESDEEPLAKKAKRIKDNLEEDIKDKNNDPQDMDNDVNGKEDATLDIKYALSRQLEPIVFDDNNGQSSDEDCILGV